MSRVQPGEILEFRQLFLAENKFQFICNKCHDYGWSDDYLFVTDGVKAGYGCIWGTDHRGDRDTIFEFFLLPAFRKFSHLAFRQLYVLPGVKWIECQTNDKMLTSLLYEFAGSIVAEAILFEDRVATGLSVDGAHFRAVNADDDMGKDDSPFVIEWSGEIVASGGLMLNYNHPFADIYMQVKEPFRKKGFGSLIVQELKREAYRIGRVPAARCNIRNPVSRATLLKAGLEICGYRLKGAVNRQ